VTTLGERKPGAWVNLEKALRLGDRVGGHLVAGHVDCIGRIVEKQQSGPGYAVGCQASSGRYLIAKGSVCVDGVSLTVNEVHGSRFRVMIIPHTAGLTGLTEKRIGDNVNIEYDMVGKYIEKFVTASGADRGVTESVLREHGFM
jgi:riboflavin synthase